MTKEARVVQETNKAAEAAGFLHRKVVYVGRHGCPDDWYFGHGGRLIIVEHKRPGEEPEPHQAREIRRLRERGFDVRVISTVEEARVAFR